MKGRLPRIYYLIPAAYVVVIVFFLLMQFQARHEFEHRVGNLELRGTYSRTLAGKDRVRRVEARFHGVGLLFSSRGIFAGGFGQIRDQAMSVQSFSLFEDGAEIGFRGGLSLRLSLQAGGERVKASLIVPEDLGGLTSLSIDFTLPSAPARLIPGLPLLSVGTPGGSVYLMLPEGCEIDLGRKRLLLRRPLPPSPLRGPGGGGLAAGAFGPPGQAELEISVERVLGSSRPYLYWFSTDLPLAGEADYEQAVRQFVERSDSYWGRLFAGNPASPEIAGPLGMALISEAIRRGEYRRTLAIMAATLRPLLIRSPDNPNLRQSAAYFGDLPGYLAFREAAAKRQIEEIARRLREADPTVFETPELLGSILDHGPLVLVEEALRLADGLGPEAESAAGPVGLLEFYLEALRLLPAAGNAAKRIAEIIDSRVFPAIHRSNRGLFLSTPSALSGSGSAGNPPATQSAGSAFREVDLLHSIRAGQALVRAGQELANDAYVSVGQNLILAALRMADSEGFLPARLTLAGREVQPAGELLAPEVVYPLVAAEPYIPREYPLYRLLGPGTWLFTASRLREIKVDDTQQRFFFAFPAGDTHYLLIQGVAPALSLVMHGIPWKSDPEYFQYSDGWAYDAASQTLFLKITHRSDQEEIVLSY
jgi:hypothetical protein